jgi:hypothetical protein
MLRKMIEGFLYKESMHWVSQIQVIRNELKRVNAELKIVQPDQAGKEYRIRFMKEIWELGQTLDRAEAILLAGLNNGTIYWAGHNHTYDAPRVDPCKDEIFDLMKHIYNTYVELQRSITGFVSGQPVSFSV